MSAYERAAQFSSFNALEGYDMPVSSFLKYGVLDGWHVGA